MPPGERVNVYDLGSFVEISELYGVKFETAQRWQQRGILPAPLPVKVSSRPMWSLPEVVAQLTDRGPVRPLPAEGRELLVNVADLIGLSEIARMYRIKRQTVDVWRGRGVLPEPLPHKVSGRPMWLRPDLIAEMARKGREVAVTDGEGDAA